MGSRSLSTVGKKVRIDSVPTYTLNHIALKLPNYRFYEGPCECFMEVASSPTAAAEGAENLDKNTVA